MHRERGEAPLYMVFFLGVKEANLEIRPRQMCLSEKKMRKEDGPSTNARSSGAEVDTYEIGINFTTFDMCDRDRATRHNADRTNTDATMFSPCTPIGFRNPFPEIGSLEASVKSPLWTACHFGPIR